MAPRVVLFALLAAAALSGSQAAAPWSQVSSPAAWTPPAEQLRGGFNPFAGINPFGYKITDLGEKFLAFDGSKESDLGRLLSSLKSRKTTSASPSPSLSPSPRLTLSLSLSAAPSLSPPKPPTHTPP
mmetsp:Transcript_27848/g.88517  ORF Transcript_27848/g.88517 Transcript_27848/m.88517 type:complete len:127 (-) Transcript_27848:203-583(-)